MNEQILRRLIDGELKPEERAQVIQRIDQQPEMWRRVALEFLHGQMLDRALGQHVAHHIDERPPLRKRPRPDRLVALTPIANRLAMAAVFALMIALGYSLGRVGHSPPFRDPEPNHAAIDETELQLTDALAKCVTPVPDSFRRELLMAGYYLAENQRLARVALPTGGTLDMPVRQFDIHYIGQDAFQ